MPRWNVETEAKIPRTVEALVECIAPLIHLSQQILLVDPHFTPDTARYQVALEHFLAAALAGGRRYCRLEYHTKVGVKDGSSESDRRDWITRFGKDCQQRIPRHVPKDVPLRIMLWEVKPGGDEMHDRYVMTERGAIRIVKGLDLGEPGQTTDVSLLPPLVYRGRWNDFQPGTGSSRRLTSWERIELEAEK